MTTGTEIQLAAAKAGLKPPEVILDVRLKRAERFAALIMDALKVVEDWNDRTEVRNALIAAAYVADAEIVTPVTANKGAVE